MEQINLSHMGEQAKKASRLMAIASANSKNQALEVLERELGRAEEAILAANEQDVTKAQQSGMSEAMLDRLSLKGRLQSIREDLKTVIKLVDPVGEVIESFFLPNGLELSKTRTPIGVLGVIYEARPNVTIDVAALAIKSGNCAILRGGSETIATNAVLVQTIQQALAAAELPPQTVQLIHSPDREHVHELLKLHQFVDMIIPRGGAILHAFCRENSQIPVITGGIGICHLYADEYLNIENSLKVILNAKVQRPTVCNALDTLLVHAGIAQRLIPAVVGFLTPYGVSFRTDEKAYSFLKGEKNVTLAQEQDWETEWLNLTLGIKVVDSLSAAISHIQRYSTGHSDGILTSQEQNAEHFLKAVDSAVVYHNASTRFTDGGQFGFGAEVAISTQKLHARGPMGLKELTSYKWIVRGNYHIRS